MIVEERILLLEEILTESKETIGNEYAGYRNHVYRMIHFCLSLKDCNEEEREKIIIAGPLCPASCICNKRAIRSVAGELKRQVSH